MSFLKIILEAQGRPEQLVIKKTTSVLLELDWNLDFLLYLCRKIFNLT